MNQNNTREIPLTRGRLAIVDAADYEWLSRYKWHFNNKGYAVRSASRDGRQRTILMHREIIKTPNHMDTDHRDGNKLNNSRDNLRACTRSENTHNLKVHADNKSGYKGVSWHKGSGQWQAVITIGGRQTNLGYFANDYDAAQAYNFAAYMNYGKFAKYNAPKAGVS